MFHKNNFEKCCGKEPYVNNYLDGEKPIFQQIKEQIEHAILDGHMGPEERIPSINEFAKEYQINPATANKGVNELVDRGIIYKKRGVGMFVSSNAVELLIEERKENFEVSYIQPLINEAERLGITIDQLMTMIGRKL